MHFTLGENGILKNAEIAGNKYKEEQQKEKNALDEMYSSILVAEDSKITLTMEQLDEYITRKIEESNANKASVVAKSSETYETNTLGGELDLKDVVFDSITGDTKNKFTLENGNIKIGPGVQRIIVEGSASAKSTKEYAGEQMFLFKNDENIGQGWNRLANKGSFFPISTNSSLIYVKEGDYINAKVVDWGAGGIFKECELMIYEY